MKPTYTLTISAEDHEQLLMALKLYIEDSNKAEVLEAYKKLSAENTILKIELAKRF